MERRDSGKATDSCQVQVPGCTPAGWLFPRLRSLITSINLEPTLQGREIRRLTMSAGVFVGIDIAQPCVLERAQGL